MTAMQKNTLKYSALVFIGGVSYGVMATTVKFALSDGFHWTQIAISQPFFGTLLFGGALLVLMLFGKRPVHISPRRIVSLMGVGISTCTTCLLYNYALTKLPVAVAITLLFQFTWIGVIIQIIVTRRRPHAAELAAAVVILGGTLLASGLFSESVGDLDPIGVACGLLSALSTALFMFLSSRVGNDLPPIQRGLFVCLGAFVLAFLACPTYFTSGALDAGIWKYGIILGVFGLLLPVVLFGIGTPHLPTGLSTIMASSELPCGILISVLILKEPIDLLQTAGVVIILGGVVISQLPNLLPARTTEEEAEQRLAEIPDQTSKPEIAHAAENETAAPRVNEEAGKQASKNL